MTHDAMPTERDLAVAAANARVPKIYVYNHSTLVYWWPASTFGFIAAFFNTVLSNADSQPPPSGLGLSYVSLLLLLVIFTNVRLRGIYSVVTLVTIAFIVVLLAWLGWWDEIAKLIPYISVRMNTGFYLVFSTGLLIIWLMMFFIFDRLTYWRIRPGQMTEERLIGGGAESFDTNSLRFQKHRADFFRVVLGLGAGDLRATTPGDSGTAIE